MTSPNARRSWTRRQVVAAGLGLAAGSGIAPAVGEAQAATGVVGPADAAEQDRLVLERLLRTERVLEFAYDQVLGSGVLKSASQQAVTFLRDQEFDHARALTGHLASLPRPSTGRPSRHGQPFPPPQIADLLQHVKNEREAIEALVEVENLAQSDYFTAVGSLHDSRLSQLAVEILGNEAQHWSLLAILLHKGDVKEAVPHPFVRGSMQLMPLHGS